MRRLGPVLGYGAAALTIVLAVAVPLKLLNVFAMGFAATGVQVDEIYTGGPVVRVIERQGYRIEVHRAVDPAAALRRASPFLQLDWRPASALPERIADAVDVDGDGRPDLVARFAVPADPKQPLRADVEPLSPWVDAVRGASRDALTRLAIRARDDAIILRIPIRSTSRIDGAPAYDR